MFLIEICVLVDLSAEEKYKLWLRERYTEARIKLLQWLTHDNVSVQVCLEGT